jgi:branched-chain amino acid transport system substrate-binding protein
LLAGSDRVRLVGLLVAVAACTPTRFDETPCSAHAQCREAFGFGAMCGPGGMCQQAPLLERCGVTYPEDLFQHPDGYRDAVVLGTLMDRSSAAHLVRERAIRLAIKEVNAAGGLDGRPVGLVSCDTQANPQLDDFTRTEASVIDGRYLARTLGVAAVVGPCASGDVEQVWDGLRGAGTLIMSPSATSPALGQLEPESSDAHPGRLWRVAPSDALQGRLIAEDLLARQVRQVALIREAGAYGEGLARVFTELFTAAGGAVQVAAIADGTQIQAATAVAAAGPAPEVLFISSQQDWVVKFLRAARGQAGFERKSIFLTDAAANQAVLDGVPDASGLFARVRGTRPAPRLASDYVYASFVANYRAEYHDQDPTAAAFSAHAYDAAWVVLYGTAWSLLQEHGISARGTGRGLRHLSAGAPTPIIPASWLGVVAAFRGGQSVNVSGASGELDFDPLTREVTAPLEVWTISALPHRIVPAAPPADLVEVSRP